MLVLCHFSLLLQQRPSDTDTVEFGAHGHGDWEVCELGAGACSASVGALCCFNSCGIQD